MSSSVIVAPRDEVKLLFTAIRETRHPVGTDVHTLERNRDALYEMRFVSVHPGVTRLLCFLTSGLFAEIGYRTLA